MPKKHRKNRSYKLKPVVIDFDPTGLQGIALSSLRGQNVEIILDPEIIETVIDGKRVIQIRGNKVVE